MQDVNKASFEGRTGSILRYATAVGNVEIQFCGPQIVRVRLAGTGAESIGYLPPRDWVATPIDHTPGDPACITTAHLALSLHTEPFRIELGSPGGESLLSDMAIAIGEGGGCRVRFAPTQGQHLYGLGHGGQQLDRLGGARQLWNSHTGRGPGSDIAIPLIVSHRGYALFFDNPSDAGMMIGRSDDGLQVVYDAKGGDLDCYILVGKDSRDLMGVVADLLGRATMPPRWFLGYQQSTRHFESTEELRQLPQELRSHHIPCDGLIFLSTYGEARGWNRMVGHLEFEPELWSNPAAIIREMREQHFEVMTHEYPVLHPESPLFSEALDNGYLLKEGYPEAPTGPRLPATYREGQRYLDFSNPDVRRWWWDQHRNLRELGVASWWLDGGEGPPAGSRLLAGDGTQLHNIYDLLRMQAFAEGEAADRPELRPVLLCRSGAAGMQRYGAACWSGDIDNTFATLEAQIPLGLNTGLSGVPYWGTDIGGFFHPTPETGELFARWFQFGAFTPVFRSHGRVWREHVPWAHGEEVERICREYTELRYRLLPYTYTLAWQAATTGLPLMRPLWLNYPDDPHVWDLRSEYLWGDDILVAPVTRDGARRWAVYLPSGEWYDFWTHEHYEGGRGVEVDAPLDRLPLFIRAGAVLPMGPVVQHTDGGPAEELTLLIYPGGPSQFELYEDDGRSNAYRRGVLATTEIRANPEATVVEIDEPRGEAGLIPQARRYLLQVRRARPSGVTVDSTAAPESRSDSPGWWYEDGFVSVRLKDRSGIARFH